MIKSYLQKDTFSLYDGTKAAGGQGAVSHLAVELSPLYLLPTTPYAQPKCKNYSSVFEVFKMCVVDTSIYLPLTATTKL